MNSKPVVNLFFCITLWTYYVNKLGYSASEDS